MANSYEQVGSIGCVNAIHVQMSGTYPRTHILDLDPDPSSGWSLWIGMDGSLHWSGNISVDEATGRFWEGIAKHVRDAQSYEMVRLRAENEALRALLT